MHHKDKGFQYKTTTKTSIILSVFGYNSWTNMTQFWMTFFKTAKYWNFFVFHQSAIVIAPICYYPLLSKWKVDKCSNCALGNHLGTSTQEVWLMDWGTGSFGFYVLFLSLNVWEFVDKLKCIQLSFKMSLKSTVYKQDKDTEKLPKLRSNSPISGTLTSPSASPPYSCKRKFIPGSTEVYSCCRSQKSKNNPWNSAI